MRPFELMLITLITVDLVVLLPALKYKWSLPHRYHGGWLVLAGVVLVLHVVVEGPRWQMNAAYAAAALLAVGHIRTGWLHALSHSPLGSWLAVSVVFLALCFSGVAGWALPVPQIPEPRGPYPVGTQVFEWTDASREEAYTDIAGDRRRLMVQVWYPTDDAPDAPRARWLPHARVIGEAFLRDLDLPDWGMDHLALTQMPAYTDAPLRGEAVRYPIIVHAHGWTGFRTVSVDQHLHLASHGYVVFAADHTYGALATVFADGEVALNRPDALPPRSAANRQPRIEQLVDTFRDDIRFMLDQIARMNAGEIGKAFAGQLDLERIGAYGHSTGASATLEATIADPRIRAALAEDVWGEPITADVIAATATTPMCFINSDGWIDPDDEVTQTVKGFFERAQAPVHLMTIQGTKHRDFTVLPLLSPLQALTYTGDVPGDTLLPLVQDTVLAFFDAYLREGDPEELAYISDGSGIATYQHYLPGKQAVGHVGK